MGKQTGSHRRISNNSYETGTTESTNVTSTDAATDYKITYYI